MTILFSWTFTGLISFVLHLLEPSEHIYTADMLSKLVHIPAIIFLVSLTISLIGQILVAVTFCISESNSVEPLTLSG